MDVFALSKLIISSFNFFQANFQNFVVLGPLIPATSTSKRNYPIIEFLYPSHTHTSSHAQPHQQDVHGPNVFLHPLDKGFPGALPRLNAHCVSLAFKAGVALGCRVQPVSAFDRKNYFYAVSCC